MEQFAPLMGSWTMDATEVNIMRGVSWTTVWDAPSRTFTTTQLPSGKSK